MVTQYETGSKKHATINLYAGIFNNKLFRGGGRQHVENGSGFESLGEDVFSDTSAPQVKSAPSDAALSSVSHRVSEKSSLQPAEKNLHKVDAELQPLSHSDVTDIEKKHLQPDVICVQSDTDDTKKNLRVNANNGLDKKNIPHLHVSPVDKRNVQNNVGSNAETYKNARSNVGHDDHYNTKQFRDESLDTMETKNVQQSGPYQLHQSMPGASQKALWRDVDVNDNAELVHGVSNVRSVPFKSGKPFENRSFMKNRKNWQTSTGGLFHSEETSSSACKQAAERPSPRRSSASVKEKILDSTAPKNGHTSSFYEKPSELDCIRSNSSVSIMSGTKGMGPELHHNSRSGNPKDKELNRRDRFDDSLQVRRMISNESTNANDVVESEEVNVKHAQESVKYHALYLSGTPKSGDASLSWDTKLYKSGLQQEAKGMGNTNGVALKESPRRGYLLEGNLRIGEPLFLDSSSSYGGSSSGGSPMALKDGRVFPSGNVLISRDSPYSMSSRSMGSVTGYGNMGNTLLSPTSSNGSPGSQWGARKSDEMVINRKSSDMAHNGYNKIKSVGTNGMCNSCTNTGKGNHLADGKDSVVNGHSNFLNNGNLLVGGTNGNVSSYGGGTKINVKQEEAKLVTVAVDYRPMKKAQASLNSEEVKNAGNEYYKAGHFSEALTLYDRAMALCPSNAMYRSNRAAALSGLGRLAEAVKECEEAIRLDSSYARAHQRAASLYIRFGLMESAKQHLHAAAEQTDFIEVQRLQKVERHFLRCVESRKLGDWQSVIRESDAAVVAGADSAPQIFGFKAEALLRLHKLEHADSVCSMAQKIESSLINLGISSQDPLLQLTRAQVNMALGRFEEAVGAAESAVRRDPSNANATALLRKARAVAKARATGNDLFRLGRLFEALAMYSEGLESDPANAVLLCNRAACRLKLCQWEKAVEDCDAALRVQPHYTKALLRRASCWTKLERWEDALQDYEVLRRELPGDAEVARGFFDVQVAMKKSRGEEIYGMKFGSDVEEVMNDEQFREAVSFPGLSVVQFITRWSDRCRELLPFINDLCRRHPCVNFVKVDVEDLPYLAKIESISFIPTFKIYKHGKKLKEIIGPSEQSLDHAVKHYSL